MLKITNATREDYGSYRAIVENSIGQDSCSVTVTVADRPEPPRAPLVENILEEAVILSWKPPMLDGGERYDYHFCNRSRFLTSRPLLMTTPNSRAGSLVTGYLIEKRDVAGGTWKQCARTRYCYTTVEVYTVVTPRGRIDN